MLTFQSGTGYPFCVVILGVNSEWNPRCDLQGGAADFLHVTSVRTWLKAAQIEGLTLFLLMKIIFPRMLPSCVKKLFCLYLSTAVLADVQFLPL